MANKMTKRMVVEMMMADEKIKDNEVYMSYLAHELELLDKKSASKGESKNQKANAGIKTDIVEVLGSIVSGTATEIQKALESFKAEYEGISNQKVSSLLRQLVADGVVMRTEDKKKAIFSLVSDEVEGE